MTCFPVLIILLIVMLFIVDTFLNKYRGFGIENFIMKEGFSISNDKESDRNVILKLTLDTTETDMINLKEYHINDNMYSVGSKDFWDAMTGFTHFKETSGLWDELRLRSANDLKTVQAMLFKNGVNADFKILIQDILMNYPAKMRSIVSTNQNDSSVWDSIPEEYMAPLYLIIRLSNISYKPITLDTLDTDTASSEKKTHVTFGLGVDHNSNDYSTLEVGSLSIKYPTIPYKQAQWYNQLMGFFNGHAVNGDEELNKVSSKKENDYPSGFWKTRFHTVDEIDVEIARLEVKSARLRDTQNKLFSYTKSKTAHNEDVNSFNIQNDSITNEMNTLDNTNGHIGDADESINMSTDMKFIEKRVKELMSEREQLQNSIHNSETQYNDQMANVKRDCEALCGINKEGVWKCANDELTTICAVDGMAL